jgi:hypothetical protein
LAGFLGETATLTSSFFGDFFKIALDFLSTPLSLLSFYPGTTFFLTAFLTSIDCSPSKEDSSFSSDSASFAFFLFAGLPLILGNSYVIYFGATFFSSTALAGALTLENADFLAGASSS